MTIGERLLAASKTGLALRVWGKTVIVQSTGARLTGEFEHIDPLTLDTELGGDPREGSYFNFPHPDPGLSVGEVLTVGADQWQVLQDKEDHPYEPYVRYKVEKL